MSLILTAIVREAGGTLDVSLQTLREMEMEAGDGLIEVAVPQTYTDRPHLHLHMPGRSEADDAGITCAAN